MVVEPDADREAIALAAGRLVGATAMAGECIRVAATQRRLSAIWDMYRRDAGAGDVGPEHVGDASDLLSTADPRRDGLLLWLADVAPPALATAASVVARMVGAQKRWGSEALELLAVALDRLPPSSDVTSVGAAERWLCAYVDRLRDDPAFVESAGETFELAFPAGPLSRYRVGSPGACWAANLILQASAPAAAAPIPPGTLSRTLFRLGLEEEERLISLRREWQVGLERADVGLFDIDRELARGQAALAGLSRNARAREAWALLVGLGGATRVQLARALGLSRGGTSLIARQLVEAGLVRLEASGALVRIGPLPSTTRPFDGALAAAAGEVDQAMADIDRLLAKAAP